MSRISVYIDGESHFHRSEAHFKKLGKSLDDVHGTPPIQSNPYAYSYPREAGVRFLVKKECKLFWDNLSVYGCDLVAKGQGLKRPVYFTAFSGDQDALHEIRRFLRGHGFEPIIVHEQRDKADHRANRLRTDGIIEKAKGVDIELTVRVLEDARADVFDECCLVTNDEDYVPLVRAVRRTGRVVNVMGYGSMLANKSEFEFVPDKFIDLEKLPYYQ